MIFLDTNIFVDVLSNRANWYEESAEIINRVAVGKEKGCISALTIPNLWYVLGEKRESIHEIKDIIKNFKVASLTPQIIETAFDSPIGDFEDAIQLHSAISNKCDFLITRNKKDFVSGSGITVSTPEEFLARRK